MLREQTELPSQKCQPSVSGKRIWYYNPVQKAVCLLREDLGIEKVISLPTDTKGTPQLSVSGDTLFYCTGSGSIACLIESGIHRLIRQMPVSGSPALTLMENSEMIACTVSSESSCFSSRDGSRLGSSPQIIGSCTLGSRDCLAIRCGSNDHLYLGTNMLPHAGFFYQ